MKKKILILLAVLLILAADWFYWTQSLSLSRQLPAKVWGQAQLWHCNENWFDGPEIVLEEGEYGRIAAALENARVTRRPKFNIVSAPWFYLIMQRPDGALVILTVGENGDISVDPGTGKKQYYDGGEELYQALLSLTS